MKHIFDVILDDTFSNHNNSEINMSLGNRYLEILLILYIRLPFNLNYQFLCFILKKNILLLIFIQVLNKGTFATLISTSLTSFLLSVLLHRGLTSGGLGIGVIYHCPSLKLHFLLHTNISFYADCILSREEN